MAASKVVDREQTLLETYTGRSLFLHHSGISTVVNNSPPARYSSYSPPNRSDGDLLMVPIISQPSTASNSDDVSYQYKQYN